jgi:hypothetical protein
MEQIDGAKALDQAINLKNDEYTIYSISERPCNSDFPKLVQSVRKILTYIS